MQQKSRTMVRERLEPCSSKILVTEAGTNGSSAFWANNSLPLASITSTNPDGARSSLSRCRRPALCRGYLLQKDPSYFTEADTPISTSLLEGRPATCTASPVASESDGLSIIRSDVVNPLSISNCVPRFRPSVTGLISTLSPGPTVATSAPFSRNNNALVGIRTTLGSVGSSNCT